MRYGVGGGIYSGMRRRASGSGGLGEHLAGLRRAEGLEGEAALRDAVARELPGDRGHEFFRAAEEVHHLCGNQPSRRWRGARTLAVNYEHSS